MQRVLHVVDLYHGDDPVDFHAIAAAGAVGVILKATQGSDGRDPAFAEYRARAITVFGAACVHSFHFLDSSDPEAQIENYLTVTQGMPGRWLDYEPLKDREGNDLTCSLDNAVTACHLLAQKQGSFPGMYGSDGDLLGRALLGGHFTVCPLWIARYGQQPMHDCDLWQFQAGEINPTILIGGRAFDLSTYANGDAEACKEWLASLAHSDI